MASGAEVLKSGSRSQNLDVGSAVTLQVTSCCSGLSQCSGEDPGPVPHGASGVGPCPHVGAGGEHRSEVTGQVKWRTRGSFWAPARGWAAGFITELPDDTRVRLSPREPSQSTATTPGFCSKRGCIS